jgi:hypothetical protein
MGVSSKKASIGAASVYSSTQVILTSAVIKQNISNKILNN